MTKKSKKKNQNRLKELEQSIRREKREKVKKVVTKHAKKLKHNAFSFEDKRWSIGVILVALVLSFFLQSILDEHLNPNTVQARVLNLRSNAVEAFQITDDFDIIELEKLNAGHYIAPGDTDIDVFSFGIKSNEEILIFEEIKLFKEGNIFNDKLIRAKLYEGEDSITESKIQKGTFYFKNFKSIIQPQTEKVYTVKLDISDETKPGARFKFSILSPYDILITKENQAIYELDRYPIEGAYVTVVGYRK